jgi:SAM-dependent methyltransferase
LPEFTGERLVPGEVDVDLWNEHLSRYAFAASLLTGCERVLDAGCGTGYGASRLAEAAAFVLGIDISEETVRFATKRYGSGRIRFEAGTCEALPVVDGSLDAVVAFEVIEHLREWRRFLSECRRVLKPSGRLIVSTPNKTDYAESRGEAGPNPFHVHEFEFEEFGRELGSYFPFVTLFGQNHAGSVILSTPGEGPPCVAFESEPAHPVEAAFFVAVCSNQPLPAPSRFVFVPSGANVLRERERHIRLLEAQTREARSEHATLLNRHSALQAELQRSNSWALSLQADLESSRERVLELQAELAREQTHATETIADYERLREEEHETLLSERAVWSAREVELQHDLNVWRDQAHNLETELASRTQWAIALDSDLAAKSAEHLKTLELLQDAQKRLRIVQSSRWHRAGRVLHLSPR